MRNVRSHDFNISPKLHLLEEHAITQMKRFRVGLGLLSEQGLEAIHAEFNRLSRRFAGIGNSDEKMLAIIRQHTSAIILKYHNENVSMSEECRKI